MSATCRASWAGAGGADVFTGRRTSISRCQGKPGLRQPGNPSPGPEVPMSKDSLYEHVPGLWAACAKFARWHQAAYDLIHSHYWLSGVAAAA